MHQDGYVAYLRLDELPHLALFGVLPPYSSVRRFVLSFQNWSMMKPLAACTCSITTTRGTGTTTLSTGRAFALHSSAHAQHGCCLATSGHMQLYNARSMPAFARDRRTSTPWKPAATALRAASANCCTNAWDFAQLQRPGCCEGTRLAFLREHE
jgi:hypothetical protein